MSDRRDARAGRPTPAPYIPLHEQPHHDRQPAAVADPAGLGARRVVSASPPAREWLRAVRLAVVRKLAAAPSLARSVWRRQPTPSRPANRAHDTRARSRALTRPRTPTRRPSIRRPSIRRAMSSTRGRPSGRIPARARAKPAPRANPAAPRRMPLPSRRPFWRNNRQGASPTHALGATDAAKGAAQATTAPRGPIDYVLLLAVAALLLVGLLMVFSASQSYNTSDPGVLFRQQLIWATLGLVFLTITARVDYHFWRRYSVLGMLITLALLVLVLKFGQTLNGGQRWLYLGLFRVQPSEAAKLAVAVYLADWLARRGDQVKSFTQGLAPFVALLGLVLGLILRQNDLGTAVIIACLALAMFFSAGATLRQMLPILGVSVVGAIAYAALSFRRARLEAFLDPLPARCAVAASYQVCQGLIALGSGGLFGRGLGDSLQKASYLPLPFNDSIFAVIGEELGLVGCALVLGLFALLAYRGFRASRQAPDAFGALLAGGITCWLVVQALVNVGSVVDAIPFTGVPLPFVSFGGSSLVTSLAAVGVLLNISRTAAGDRRRAPR
jgi:cell division protein FtsW